MVDIFGDVLNNAGGREALGLADGVLAASLVSRFFLNMALSCFAMKPPVPSMVLRKMLPE